jgi:hypothetical protein
MPTIANATRLSVPSGSASAGVSYAPAAGSNRGIGVVVHYFDGSEALTALPTITFGAANLSVLHNHVVNTPNDCKQFFHYLLAPAGTATLTVTKAAAGHIAEAHIFTLLDLNQATPFRAVAAAENAFSAGPAAVVLAGAQATDLAIGWATATFGPTLTENQTLVAEFQAAATNFFDLSGGVAVAAGADPLTFSWALGSSGRWRAAAVAAVHAAGGGGGNPGRRRYYQRSQQGHGF